MLKYRVTRGSAQRPWLRPLFFERLESRFCLSTTREHILKRQLLLATLVGIVMTAFAPCASADLYVGSHANNSVLRYSATTGDFIDAFVPAGSGGLEHPFALVFGPDGNLYVISSGGPNKVMRYDGTTGAPLPSPGNTGAV